MGGITVHYYPSDIDFTENIERWFYILANSLELLPPTRFGLVVETLRYILGLYENEPTEFDIKLLKSMLASHEIYFKARDNPNRFDELAIDTSTKYRTDDVAIMMELLAHLELNPTLPLQFYMKEYTDLEYLIYLFLILEKEGLIDVDRPGIIDTTEY